jgi:hemerythrin superfamily protein
MCSSRTNAAAFGARRAGGVGPARPALFHAAPAMPRGARLITRFTGGNGIVDVVTNEHREVKKLFDDFQKPNTSDEHKQRIAYDVIHMLSVHSEKEEIVLYPAISKHYGKELGDHLLHDQHQLKKMLSDLDSMKASQSDFDATFMKAMKATLKHIEDEETNCLKRMSSDLPQEELQKLAHKWEKTTATTRPHPLAPNVPPFNAAANAATKPLDQLRDTARNAMHPKDESS